MCIIYTWGVLSTNLGPVFPPFFIGWNPNPRYDPPNRWRCPHRESWTRRRSRRARQFAWIDPFFVLLNTGWIYKKGVSKWGEGPSNRQKRWPSPEVFFGGSPTRGQTPVNDGNWKCSPRQSSFPMVGILNPNSSFHYTQTLLISTRYRNKPLHCLFSWGCSP